MKAICMFNNKGGVGKTTLSCNIASLLASKHKLRVLVIDCDPQCNSTQLMLGEEECSRAYYSDSENRKFRTILDVVKPLLEGDASVDSSVELLGARTSRFGVNLLPGHPKFSLTEDILSEAWGNVRGGDLGGIRKTNWFFAYCQGLRDAYDVAIVDVGPSLGSINRSILLGADGFAAPMGSDIFSLIGVKNVAEWLKKWSVAYNRGVEVLFEEQPILSRQHPIRPSAGVTSGFFGYTVQQYIAKTVRGERRPTQAFEDILSRVPREIVASLGEFAAPGIVESKMKLGEIPNMFSLVPMAQSASSPIHDLKSADGIRGAQYTQQEEYIRQLQKLASNLAKNASLSRGI